MPTIVITGGHHNSALVVAKLLLKKDVKVIPWTVNEIADMKKMKEINTDGLITDYPNRAKGLF